MESNLCTKGSKLLPVYESIIEVVMLITHHTNHNMKIMRVSYIRFVCCILMTVTMTACGSPGQRANWVQENDILRRDKANLERAMAQRDVTISNLRKQIVNLKTFHSDRPADMFSPVKLEIASLSGGDDYDGKPGDDGITVHLRMRDADGDLVKAPGRITIQLIDATRPGSPGSIGVYRFNDPEKLRAMWHGRFGTQHYTLKCPFSSQIEHSSSRKVIIAAEFEDYLTGRVLTATKEVEVAIGE